MKQNDLDKLLEEVKYKDTFDKLFNTFQNNHIESQTTIEKNLKIIKDIQELSLTFTFRQSQLFYEILLLKTEIFDVELYDMLKFAFFRGRELCYKQKID